MNRNLKGFYDSQFKAFSGLLTTQWCLPDEFIKKNESLLKSIYKKFLSIACLSTVVGYKSARNEYSIGLIESCHLALVFAAKGIENTSSVLLRQSIEHTYKHIYFSTHPVEYLWALKKSNYRELSFQCLHTYIGRTDEIENFKLGKTSIDQICDKFATYSRYVHVHSQLFFDYKKPDFDYKPDDSLLRKFEDQIKILWPLLTTLLIIFFPSKYNKASELEKRIIRAPLVSGLLSKVDEYLLSLQ